MNKIPVYNICNIHDSDNNDIVVTDLRSYLDCHKTLVFPHRHSFYQILYITVAGGDHVIDFENYPVKQQVVFFLAPGQIHEWKFTHTTDGILVNIGNSFFSNFFADSHYLDNLLFFSSNGKYSAIDFAEEKEMVAVLFHQLLKEYTSGDEGSPDMLRALLLQLFVLTNRKIDRYAKATNSPNQYRQFLAFEKLVEQHYMQKRLPREYAEMLFITPNYLNAICIKHTGRQAGDLIRSRILLEAKRLLAHSDLTISEIAWQLNFENNSYFSRFFKKYENMSPEEFRRLKK